MTIHPPHIPPDVSQGAAARAPKISKFVITALAVGGLAGFVAAIAYAAYGPGVTPNFQAPQIQREATGWSESGIMAAQESTVSLIPDRVVAVKTPAFETPDVAGYATVITSDGWLLTTAANTKGKRALARPQTILPFKSVLVDMGTSLAFVKVDAKNLHVLDHSAISKLARGMQLAIITPHRAIPVTLQDMSFCIAEHCPWENADRLSYAPVIMEQLPLHSVDGAAVITPSGALVGVVATANNRLVIIPIDVLQQQFATVFAEGKIAERGFPVQVLNLTRWSVIDNTGKLPERGLLVQAIPQPGRYLGVFTDIKDGDIIAEVEHEPVQADTTLFDIVRTFESQPQITMTIIRKGVSQDIHVHPVPIQAN